MHKEGRKERFPDRNWVCVATGSHTGRNVNLITELRTVVNSKSYEV